MVNYTIVKAERNDLKNVKNIVNPRKENLLDFKQTEYLLDAGDNIEILFYEPKELSTTVEIMSNGNAIIPLLGAVYLKDQTFKSAKKIIGDEFKKILIEPRFDLILREPRPIKISLIGEFFSPGIYTLPFKIANPGNTLAGFTYQPSDFKYHPTIVDAIQIAGGISPDANLDNIEISRRTLNENVIKTKTVNISLTELFIEGDFSNNILLSDGDIIKIEKRLNEKNDNYQIINANLLPKKVPVYVVGEVKNPGLHNIPINSTLIDTILIAGGPVNARANRNKVQLTRKLQNNNIERKNFNINYSKKNLKKNNPAVKENDIIFVQSTTLAKVSDNFYTLTKPITNIISIYTLIKLVDD